MTKNRRLSLLIGFFLITAPLLIKSAGNYKQSGHTSPETSAGLLKVAGQNVIDNFVNAARAQIGTTVSYDPTYRTLKYPNGDVPIESGVCTDVLIRALRSSLNLDLQKLVHEDMQAHFSAISQALGFNKNR